MRLSVSAYVRVFRVVESTAYLLVCNTISGFMLVVVRASCELDPGAEIIEMIVPGTCKLKPGASSLVM